MGGMEFFFPEGDFPFAPPPILFSLLFLSRQTNADGRGEYRGTIFQRQLISGMAASSDLSGIVFVAEGGGGGTRFKGQVSTELLERSHTTKSPPKRTQNGPGAFLIPLIPNYLTLCQYSKAALDLQISQFDLQVALLECLFTGKGLCGSVFMCYKKKTSSLLRVGCFPIASHLSHAFFPPLLFQAAQGSVRDCRVLSSGQPCEVGKVAWPKVILWVS